MTYSCAGTVNLGLTGLDGVVALGDSVVELGAANHCDGVMEVVLGELKGGKWI